MTPALDLALKDLRHDWRASLCFVAALVGVLAPMLTILALKNGVVDGMVGRLVENPTNRELIPVGAGAYGVEFFDGLRARPDVAFVIPASRSINTAANAVSNPARRPFAEGVPLIPSGAGDPLIDGPSVAPGKAYASAALLQQISASPGDQIHMVIGRQIGGRRETVLAPLVVIGEVPATLQPRPALYVALADLLAVEVYRDRAEVTAETWRDQPLPARYASFRLYARDLVDLAPLEAALEAEGVRVRPRAPNAPLLIEFRNRLDRLFLVIAALAYVGFWAAMAANLRAGVERQRIAFSLFGLLGLSGIEARAIPLIQGIVLILTGISLSLALVVPFLGLANEVFIAGADGMVARLDGGTILATVTLGLLTALTAGAWAAAAAGRIGADEVLRHA